MKQFCKYHPTQPAQFYCPDCGDHYCPDCIDTKKTGPFGSKTSRVCVRCGSEVQWLGVGNVIEPLTSRIPKIFLYGFTAWPIALNVLICLGNYVFSLPSLMFFLLRLVLFALLLKYAFSALRETARGKLAAPPAWGDSVSTDFSPVFKQFLIYVVVAAVTAYLGARGGRAVAIVLTFAGLAYLPAMIIMLAATDSMITALNPLRFGPLAFRVGKDYLLMFLFLAILLGAPTALWSAFLQHLPQGIGLLLVQFAFNYYLIIAYHLMGYVILLHHDEIGYKIEYDDFKEAGGGAGKREATPGQQLLSRVNVLIKEGAMDEALELIRSKLRHEPLADAEIAERYFDLVQLKNRTDILRDRGEEMFRLLLAAKKKQKAAAAYAALAAVDPSFSPDSGDLYKIAGWLSDAGKYKESLAAYSRFIKGNPDHEFIVPAYFASARLFNEGLGKPEKSKEVLTWLQKKYPHHELMGHVRSYLTKLSA